MMSKERQKVQIQGGVEEEQSTKQKTKQAPEVANTIHNPSTEQEKENDKIEE
jgi:hypothetical protein